MATSAIGTQRTFVSCRLMSAFGGKAGHHSDMRSCLLDPGRTLSKFIALGKKIGSPRQPQKSTTDCDKQKKSQDTASEEQIYAFLRWRYPYHSNYNGPKRR